jgi:hypothetical protein
MAEATPNFQVVKGAGEGDYATLQFMAALRAKLKESFGVDFSEKKICGPNSFAVDFYIPEESTIIEVALGLPNPASERKGHSKSYNGAGNGNARVASRVYLAPGCFEEMRSTRANRDSCMGEILAQPGN